MIRTTERRPGSCIRWLQLVLPLQKERSTKETKRRSNKAVPDRQQPSSSVEYLDQNKFVGFRYAFAQVYPLLSSYCNIQHWLIPVESTV